MKPRAFAVDLGLGIATLRVTLAWRPLAQHDGQGRWTPNVEVGAILTLSANGFLLSVIPLVGALTLGVFLGGPMPKEVEAQEHRDTPKRMRGKPSARSPRR